jgi:hypothetical protein
MTERSIFSGKTPQVIIRSGGDVVVKGYDSDQVLAESSGIWGLQLKRKKNAIEVQIGGNGQVLVPFDSSVVVYAGRNAEIQSIEGTISAVAGHDLNILNSNVLGLASAGGKMNIDCKTIATKEMKLTSGWHLRCQIRDLTDVRYQIDDLRGKRQVVIGDGLTRLSLKAGGDVHIIAEGEEVYHPPSGSFEPLEEQRPSQT